MSVDKKTGRDSATQSPDSVDLGRRKLLGSASQAALVAPVLTVLSFSSHGQTPPPIPSDPPLSQSTPDGAPDGKSRVKSRTKPRKKPKEE
jgi:hypothetical protein